MKLKFREYIYNGFLAIGSDSTWVSNPRRAAWVWSTLASMLWVMSAYAVFLAASEEFIDELPIGEKTIRIGVIVAFVLLSDIRSKNHFFGAKPIELSQEEKYRLARFALLYAIFGFVVFLGTNIFLFAQWPKPPI